MRSISVLIAIVAISSISNAQNHDYPLWSNSNNKNTSLTDMSRSKKIEIEQIEFSETIKTGNATATYSAKVDYPKEGPSGAVGAIRRWIMDLMCDSIDKADGNWNSFDKIITDDDVEAALRKNGVRFLTECKEDLSKTTDIPGMEMSQEIKKIFENDKVVTYQSSDYIYTGGAHGMNPIVGQSFTTNGVPIGWNIFKPDSEKELTDIVKRALMLQYFDVKSATEFDSIILGDFSLPSTVPYVVEKGLRFMYEQYEIAPYSAGHPYCDIPLERLKGLLNSFVNL